MSKQAHKPYIVRQWHEYKSEPKKCKITCYELVDGTIHRGYASMSKHLYERGVGTTHAFIAKGQMRKDIKFLLSLIHGTYLNDEDFIEYNEILKRWKG